MTNLAHRPLRATATRAIGITTSALLAVALAACTPSGSSTTTHSASSSSASPGVTHSATTTTTTAPRTTPAPSTTPAPTAAAGPARCTASRLHLSLTAGGGGAAGSQLPYIVFTNSGSASCTLYGRPGVSFVGNGNGTQLGAAADFDLSVAAATVTLAPGGSAHAPLKITVAQNYDAATCQPSAADGFRIYPPGETHAIFLASTGYTACVNATVHLLTVQAVQPGT